MGQSPIPPTSDNVNRYIRCWNDTERWCIEQKAVSELFKHADYQDNNILDIVIIKVNLINSIYNTNLSRIKNKLTPAPPGVFCLSKAITKIDGINELIKSGHPDAVAKIATAIENGPTYYSFASKFCFNCNPAHFPIYDENVRLYLLSVCDSIGLDNCTDGRLRDYNCYIDILNRFKCKIGLPELTYADLDKFLWQAGDPLRRYRDAEAKKRKQEAR